VGLGLAALAPARAQVFGPAAVNGAVFGGLAGGIIGSSWGRHDGWAGAAIGAGAGLLLGSVADSNNAYYAGSGPACDEGYTPYYSQPNYALGGAVAGGVIGGIIGNNSGHRNGWAGAAIGAGLGYLIGASAEQPVVRRGYYYIPRSVQVAPQAAPQAAPAPVPAPRPMDAANSLFGR